MKILMISPEAGSWKEHSSLAEVVNSFAEAYKRKGAEILVISPFFTQRLQDRTDFSLIASGTEKLRGEPYEIWTDGLPYHAHVGNNQHFDRTGIYHDPSQYPYHDNHLRFSFLVSAALDYASSIGFVPDLIHAHEWGAGLAGAIARGTYGAHFANVPVTLTLHNVAYDFYCNEQDIVSIGLPIGDFNIDGYEYWGKVSLLKSAVLYSDHVILTSPGYRDHVLSTDMPGGIRGFLERHGKKLLGIQNGLDYAAWCDESHRNISLALNERKRSFKDKLRALVGLPDRPEFLLYTHIDSESGRTAEILSTILSNIMHIDMQLVIGIRDSHPDYGYFRSVAEQNPHLIALVPSSAEFPIQNALCAADALFSAMPAEPSASLILKALACGCIPLTSHETGCASLLVNYSGHNADDANAMVAREPSPDHMLRLLRFAVDTYANNRADWDLLMRNASEFRYPWDTTVSEYLLTLRP